MPIQIAFIRGINVGGHNKLAMKELVATLQELGLKNVRTYIQSGNVVFQSAARSAKTLQRKIAAAIEQSHGFHPEVLVMSAAKLASAIDKCPYSPPEDEEKKLGLYFLAKAPASANLDGAEKLRAKREQFELVNTVFYLYAPDGMGRSKLAASVERLLGVAATARNLRTARKVLDLAQRPD